MILLSFFLLGYNTTPHLNYLPKGGVSIQQLFGSVIGILCVKTLLLGKDVAHSFPGWCRAPLPSQHLHLPQGEMGPDKMTLARLMFQMWRKHCRVQRVPSSSILSFHLPLMFLELCMYQGASCMEAQNRYLDWMYLSGLYFIDI